MKHTLWAISLLCATQTLADTRTVFLEDLAGTRIDIATVEMIGSEQYKISMNEDAFEDHFLSMRPFKCLEGPEKNWCHVPYPYEIARDLSDELTDLDYDFLFVWKDATDYGINMWNGVYYQIERDGPRLIGTLHEMDMDVLSAPPSAAELRPLSPEHLHASDPENHWLPRLIIQ